MYAPYIHTFNTNNSTTYSSNAFLIQEKSVYPERNVLLRLTIQTNLTLLVLRSMYHLSIQLLVCSSTKQRYLPRGNFFPSVCLSKSSSYTLSSMFCGFLFTLSRVTLNQGQLINEMTTFLPTFVFILLREPFQ